jgi:hypothetical protein
MSSLARGLAPASYTTTWGTTSTHIPNTQIPALIKRLGNLTLLATRLNFKAANGDFDEKKKHFAKSAIAMTKDLCILPDWTPPTITTRQEAMADLAVKAWPSKPK